MIRLDLKREPLWLDLGHGVRLHVRPCTTALMMAAAVTDWEGVGDVEGNAALVTPASIDALIDLWPIASAFENVYLGPALLLDEEKNA